MGRDIAKTLDDEAVKARSKYSSIIALSRAIKKGDKWIINGSKIFITNGPLADFMVFYAKTDPEKGPHGISTFMCFPKKQKGWSCEKIKKWGMRTSPTGLVTFEDMELPEEYLIGGLNKGVSVLTSGLCTERITLSGCTLGSMRSCLELSLKYSQERVQFGKPIASFQSIQEKLANMYCGYKASRWMAYSAAAYCDTLSNKSGGKGTDLDRMAAAWPNAVLVHLPVHASGSPGSSDRPCRGGYCWRDGSFVATSFRACCGVSLPCSASWMATCSAFESFV